MWCFTPVPIYFLAGLHRGVPVNFTKLHRATFLKNTLEWLWESKGGFCSIITWLINYMSIFKKSWSASEEGGIVSQTTQSIPHIPPAALFYVNINRKNHYKLKWPSPQMVNWASFEIPVAKTTMDYITHPLKYYHLGTNEMKTSWRFVGGKFTFLTGLQKLVIPLHLDVVEKVPQWLFFYC